MLEVLGKLPITNRTIVKESKIMTLVEKWANSSNQPAAQLDLESDSVHLPLPVAPDRPVISILSLHREQKIGKKHVTFADNAAGSDSDLSDSQRVTSSTVLAEERPAESKTPPECTLSDGYGGVGNVEDSFKLKTELERSLGIVKMFSGHSESGTNQCVFPNIDKVTSASDVGTVGTEQVIDHVRDGVRDIMVAIPDTNSIDDDDDSRTIGLSSVQCVKMAGPGEQPEGKEVCSDASSSTTDVNTGGPMTRYRMSRRPSLVQPKNGKKKCPAVAMEKDAACLIDSSTESRNFCVTGILGASSNDDLDAVMESAEEKVEESLPHKKNPVGDIVEGSADVVESRFKKPFHPDLGITDCREFDLTEWQIAAGDQVPIISMPATVMDTEGVDSGVVVSEPAGLVSVGEDVIHELKALNSTDEVSVAFVTEATGLVPTSELTDQFISAEVSGEMEQVDELSVTAMDLLSSWNGLKVGVCIVAVLLTHRYMAALS